MNKELNRFAYRLCSIYSKDGELDINDISEFDLNEFSSLLIKNDKYLASEATGPDNSRWESEMLPALTRYLSYFMPMIQDLLDRQLIEYNFDKNIFNKSEGERAWA